MKIIAVITARSGSKSIPDKNIRNLGGIPLLGWSLKALSKSTMVDEIIFSSDSNSYFEIAKSINDGIIFHKRSSELSEDVPSELVLLDVIEKFDSVFDDNSIIVLIQPTTPFLSTSNIDECINNLVENPKMNTSVSVKILEEYPEWTIHSQPDNPNTGICKDIMGSLSVRQNLSKRFIPNGGIYAMKVSFLKKEKKIIDNETLIYEMSKLSSIDIDNEADFLICDSLVKSGIVPESKY